MKKKNIYLILILVVIFISTIIDIKIETGGFKYYQSGLDIAPAILIGFLIFAWCIEHAKYYEIELPKGSALLAGLLAPIGVPVYFFRGFGFKEGFLKTIKSIGFLVIISIDVIFALWVVDDPLFYTSNTTTQHIETRVGFEDFNNENYEPAFNKLHDLASLDNMDAQARVAWMYLKGKGVEQNNEQAVFWYTKAAEQDDITAQYHLATLYDQGEVVQQNTKEAVKWYTRAAESGNINSQYLLGFMYFNDESIKDYKESIKWYKMAAKQGNTIAQYNLASMYYYGNGVVVNYKKAFEWFKKSANQNDASAQNAVASMYFDGLGVDKNYTEAHTWYLKAAEQSNPDAQVNLADMYVQGNGVEVDIEKAKYWLRKANENGDIRAKELLEIVDKIYKKY